jgi:hypothetical protein
VSGRLAALEQLDDAHAAAAARARRIERFIGSLAITIGLGRGAGHRHAQKLARGGDALGLGGAGEEAVMADAMEGLRQDVDEEAADELAGGERHGGVTLTPFGAVVLDSERHGPGIGLDEATVRDGDAVGVAGQIP